MNLTKKSGGIKNDNNYQLTTVHATHHSDNYFLSKTARHV